MLYRTYTPILLLILFPVFLTGQELYFPPLNDDWETMDPSELEWCEDRIDSLYEMLAEKDTKAFILLKDGRIVLEKYFDQFTKDSLWYWASAGKSLAAFMVGMAQEEGYLDIQDPVSDYLGRGWTSCTPSQEENIKVWHQITMTTGLDERGVDPDCLDPSCLKYRTEPGTRWYYHNAPYRLVQDVVAAATGMSFQQYKTAKLLFTTGITGTWFNYVYYSTPRAMARFGLLMLAEGEWNGNDILSDKNYLRAMTESSQTMNEAYGYLWWLNGKNSYQLPGLPLTLNGKIVESAPDDMYAALGKNDQKIYVVPSQNIVVIRMGNKAGDIPLYSVSSFDDILWEYINLLNCRPTRTTAQLSNNISVYPNPSSGSLVLEGIPDKANWKILDLFGRTVLNGTGAQKRLDISGCNSGNYFFLVTDEKRNILFRTRIQFLID